MLRLSGRIGEDGLIEQVLERKSSFSRKVAGARTDEQVVAANVDHLLVVMGLDGDFNVRRLERFLATAHESGAEPVVVLNKTDVAEDLEGQTEAATAVAGDVPVVLTAAKAGEGLDQLRAILEPAITVALVGSSGVGKSTLVNALYGETVMKTRKVRESDDRGKHTTTHRELIRLPNGCLLIDNPGIRELQLWDAGEGLGETFGDIAQLAAGCRFRDCQHEDEPGCAVHAAVETGDLEAGRLESYRKMLAELAHLERRQDNLAKLEEKRKWRSVTKWYRKHHKPRD